MSKVLSAEQINQYERDGILFPIPVLSTDEVSMFRSANGCMRVVPASHQHILPHTDNNSQYTILEATTSRSIED